MNFEKITGNELNDVYRLMQVSFPPEEFRTFAGASALLDRLNYQILAVRRDGQLVGFIAEWRLKTIRFVEHFAVDPAARGQGIGSRMMKAYLRRSDLPVVVEVEAGGTEMALRRISFYERLGFAMSEAAYFQPLLRSDGSDILLRLMFYPAGLSGDAMHEAEQQIFDTVYTGAVPRRPDNGSIGIAGCHATKAPRLT